MRRQRARSGSLAPSRREFLKAAALGGAASVVAPSEGRPDATDASVSGPEAAPERGARARLLSDAEHRALSALADHVLPEAGAWGAADYIENLLTCLDGPVPRLYAGPMGAGEDWMTPDRVRHFAWKLRIEGSDAVEVPPGMLQQPVRGLRPLMREGAREAAGGFAEGQSTRRVWGSLSSEFRDAFTELVVEGSLGDPIYGGHRGGAAWRAFHFEGAMLGYGSYAAAHPPPGASGGEPGGAEGPDPLGPFTRAALWLMGFFSRRIS